MTLATRKKSELINFRGKMCLEPRSLSISRVQNKSVILHYFHLFFDVVFCSSPPFRWQWSRSYWASWGQINPLLKCSRKKTFPPDRIPIIIVQNKNSFLWLKKKYFKILNFPCVSCCFFSLLWRDDDILL